MRSLINGLATWSPLAGGMNCEEQYLVSPFTLFLSYRWLTEGFATYMETLASSSVQSSMKLEEQFPVEKIFQFMEADSLPTSHPLSINSTNRPDFFQLYDSISYYKGATVIRMASMILGTSTFQHGLRMYLTAFSFNSTTQEDLWKSLSEAANHTIDVEKIMKGWTRQAGYPIVEVKRIYNNSDGATVGGRMTISQRSFSLLPTVTTKENLWWIPFKYFDKTFNQVCKQHSCQLIFIPH